MLFNSLLTKKNLTENELHLWTITPQKVIQRLSLESLKKLLNQEELTKVANYRLLTAQQHALITRAFVRSVLALYSDLEPAQLTFNRNQHGKPELSNSVLPLRFNLSHNDNLIICAVCLNHDLGCDVESLNRKISVNNIAKRYFANAEFQALQTVESSQQATRFFEYWTLKEAFVKATGVGISLGLDTFSFVIDTAREPKFNDNITLTLSPKCRIKHPQNWYHCLIYPDHSHCIALSVNRKSHPQPPAINMYHADDYLA